MEQNNIWMRYFIIGITGSLLLFLASCKTNDYSQSANYQFINTTDYHITYSHDLGKYNLNPKEEKFFFEDQISPKKIDKSTYDTPFKIRDFEVLIKFNNVKCLIVSPSGTFGPLNIKNYVAEKVNKRTYKFTYTFTEADYNRAVTCP